MPIEFRCTACQKLLRTPDGTAGKEAKCPECGVLTEIPSRPPPAGPQPAPGTPFDGGAASGAPLPPPAAENPYQSPLDYKARPFAPPIPPPGTFAPTRIEFGDVFGRTFRIFGRQWAQCLLAFLVVLGLSLVAIGVACGLGILGAAVGGDRVLAVVLLVFAIGLAMLFITWLAIGQRLFFLKLARGDEPTLGELFRGGPFFLTTILAGLLFALAYLGGLALLIVPGIIFALMFSQFNYLIIDRNADAIESLTISKQITYGNKAMLLAILLVANLVGQLVMQACALGILVVAPFLSLLSAVVYLAMTGQATADQRYGWDARWAPPMTFGSPFAQPPSPQPVDPNITDSSPNSP